MVFEIIDEMISTGHARALLAIEDKAIAEKLQAARDTKKAKILSIEKNKFIEIMESDFELTKIFIKSQAIKIRRLYRQMKNSTPIKVEKRVAAKLWKLAKDYGVEVEEGTMINLNISVTYLADMFGAPRETISRALRQLQELGLAIYENKRIIIIDMDKLASFFKGTLKE